jgi:hypothetical protein
MICGRCFSFRGRLSRGSRADAEWLPLVGLRSYPADWRLYYYGRLWRGDEHDGNLIVAR